MRERVGSWGWGGGGGRMREGKLRNGGPLACFPFIHLCRCGYDGVQTKVKSGK